MMARKLKPEEATVFADVLQKRGVTPPEPEDEVLIQKLNAQRDAALVLSTELGLWFGVEVPARHDY